MEMAAGPGTALSESRSDLFDTRRDVVATRRSNP